MTRRIFLIDEQRELRQLHEKPYGAEVDLQALIARYPDLIPGDEIDPDSPRRWLLVSREESVPGGEDGSGRWSLDHLFLDQDAVPTLVEVKRGSDSRVRRNVVGQMLDYAANAVAYWPVEQPQAWFTRTCEGEGRDPGEVLDEFLESREPAAFWKLVKTNLQAGRVRLVFLSDEIAPELARIIEFLNEQMDPAEVLAVEVPQYIGEGVQTLIPTIIGRTASSERRKSAGGRITRTWDAGSFLEGIEGNCGPKSRKVVARLMTWVDERGLRRWFGTGATNPSFMPRLDIGDSAYSPFGIYLEGRVEIRFQYLASWPGFEDPARLAELLARLNEIDGVFISEDRLEGFPSFQVELLENPAALQQFVAVLEWCCDELERAAKSGGAESKGFRS